MNHPKLTAAARALVEIERLGVSIELCDEIAAARMAHRENRLRQTIGQSSQVGIFARQLRRFTGLPPAECESAMQEALSPEWSTVAAETIINFARRILAEENGQRKNPRGAA